MSFLTVKSSVLLLTLGVLLPCAFGGSVSYVGGDTSTGGAWRSAGVTKSLDADGNSVYGSDGYSVVALGGSMLQLPSYVSAVENLAGSEFAAAAYALVDKVGGGTVRSGLWYTVGASSETNFASITLSSTVSFRLGVMVDNSNALTASASSLRVRQTVGGSADSGLQASNGGFNLSPDWYFFDISGVSGDQFVVSGMPVDTGVTSIGGVTFDTVLNDVPEPSAWALLASGVVALVARRGRAR